MSQSVEQINEALAGFTDIEELSLGPRSRQERYDLRVVLTDARGGRIALNCGDVSGLKITDFGGGLSQILCLRAEDVRSRRLDRVSFHFADKERDTVAFDCATVDVERSS